MAFIGPLSPSAGDSPPLYVKDKVVLKIATQEIGAGDLIITESAFMWRPEHRNDGISIPWTSVSLHAISAEPRRNIYMQLDFKLHWPGVYEEKNNNENGNNAMNENGNGHAADDEDEGNVSGRHSHDVHCPR